MAIPLESSAEEGASSSSPQPPVSTFSHVHQVPESRSQQSNPHQQVSTINPEVSSSSSVTHPCPVACSRRRNRHVPAWYSALSSLVHELSSVLIYLCPELSQDDEMRQRMSSPPASWGNVTHAEHTHSVTGEQRRSVASSSSSSVSTHADRLDQQQNNVPSNSRRRRHPAGNTGFVPLPNLTPLPDLISDLPLEKTVFETSFSLTCGTTQLDIYDGKDNGQQVPMTIDLNVNVSMTKIKTESLEEDITAHYRRIGRDLRRIADQFSVDQAELCDCPGYNHQVCKRRGPHTQTSFQASLSLTSTLGHAKTLCLIATVCSLGIGGWKFFKR